MQQSFGDLDYADCLSWLERQGNPLPKLKRLIPWESFRGDFKGLYKQERQEKRKGGRAPTDCIVILKILVLQDMYKLSDDQAQYQLRDRLSFRDFLGLRVSDKVPDAKTLWLFRERLKDSGLLSGLFERMLSYVNAAGFRARKGQTWMRRLWKCPGNATAGTRTRASRAASRRIHRKGARGKPLSARSQEANRKRSRHRARVEHVFAQQGERLVRTIGKARAAVKVGLQNLVYNMRRFVWLAG